MTGRKIYPVFYEEETIPFEDSEEVWFWYWDCLRSKKMDEGSRRQKDETAMPRPCEFNDICIIVKNLYQKRCIGRDHFSVLAKFGKKSVPPDIRFGDRYKEELLWQEAMHELSEIFIKKGIIKCS